MLSQAQLEALAGTAATLDERLAASPAPRRDSAPLEAWAKAFAGGKLEVLRRRLAWDGLTEKRAAAALSSPTPFSGGSLPEWTSVLQDALALAPSLAKSRLPLPEMARGFREAPPRFGDVWVPFVRVGLRRLLVSSPRLHKALRPSALGDLEASLLYPVSFLGELLLYERFDARRRAGSGSYATFVASLLEGELETLLVQHPALARLVSLITLRWAESVSELTARLLLDEAELKATFGAELPVVAVTPGLSDRHAGGRSIAFLRFDAGATTPAGAGPELVYKPRSVDAETAFQDVLAWLSREGLAEAPPALRMLRRDGYGYAEKLSPAELSSGEEAEAYFRRAGALLFSAWLLGADDLHMENVIATRSGPVVVDTESAFQPERATPDGPRSAAARAGERLYRSFSRTGLLTTLVLDGGGRSVDIGGLRGEGGFATGGSRRVFLDPNTDAMSLSSEPTVAAGRQNLPLLDGRRLLPDTFAGPLQDGFAAAYRFVRARREDVAREVGVIVKAAAGASACATRLVFRPSELYARVLHELATPRHLTDGLSRSFLLDTLNRVFAGSEERPLLWPLTGEERRALDDFDIPYFAVPADSTVVTSRGGDAIQGYLAASGLDALKERLERLSDDDLGAQTALLRAHLVAPEPAAEGETPLARHAGLPEDDLVRFAFELAAQVVAMADRGDDGGLTWLTPGALREIDRPFKGSSFSLYEGSAGIALLFAALAAVSGREGLLQEARAACLPLSQALARPDIQAQVEAEAIGAGEGLGSLVYALALLARLTGDGFYLDLSRRAATLVTPERIARDEADDLVAGAAGAAVALLGLHEVSGDVESLYYASLCGERLLERCRRPAPDQAAWPLADGRCLGGLAHGTAGNAMALARLAAATGHADFAEAARAACRYERTLYDPAVGNWPIVGKDAAEKRQVMTAWCHGAPGIALSRLTLAPALGGEELWDDLDKALTATRRAGLLTTDHCCCGNAGLVETLLAAGARLGRPDLIQEARERAAVMVGRAISRGGFVLQAGDSGALAPGFFRGLAGIGYTLLRAARPELLPGVLRFEVHPDKGVS